MSHGICFICSNRNCTLHKVKDSWKPDLEKYTGVKAKKTSLVCCNHFEKKSCCKPIRLHGTVILKEFSTRYYTSAPKRPNRYSELRRAQQNVKSEREILEEKYTSTKI